MASLPDIWTVDEVAEYLKTDTVTVSAELESGRLRGFLLGTEWRCTESDIRGYVEWLYGRRVGPSVTETAETDGRTEDFASIGKFVYRWPHKKDVNPTDSQEEYDPTYETTRHIGGRSYVFTVGFARREVGGQNRRRVTVWLNRSTPLVEFVGTDDYESTGRLASVIKQPDGRHLKRFQELPNEYREFETGPYDSLVRVRYASRGMAVVAREDDLETIVRHAMIRARWKKRV